MLALQRLSRASEQTDLVPVQRRCAAARCGLHEMVHPQLADDGRVLPAVLRRRQLELLLQHLRRHALATGLPRTEEEEEEEELSLSARAWGCWLSCSLWVGPPVSRAP